jgi:hypothetical protein
MWANRSSTSRPGPSLHRPRTDQRSTRGRAHRSDLPRSATQALELTPVGNMPSKIAIWVRRRTAPRSDREVGSALATRAPTSRVSSPGHEFSPSSRFRSRGAPPARRAYRLGHVPRGPTAATSGPLSIETTSGWRGVPPWAGSDRASRIVSRSANEPGRRACRCPAPRGHQDAVAIADRGEGDSEPSIATRTRRRRCARPSRPESVAASRAMSVIHFAPCSR